MQTGGWGYIEDGRSLLTKEGGKGGGISKKTNWLPSSLPLVENFSSSLAPILTFSIFTKMIDFFDDHRLSA
jgi:hypothetical protein